MSATTARVKPTGLLKGFSGTVFRVGPGDLKPRRVWCRCGGTEWDEQPSDNGYTTFTCRTCGHVRNAKPA